MTGLVTKEVEMTIITRTGKNVKKKNKWKRKSASKISLPKKTQHSDSQTMKNFATFTELNIPIGTKNRRHAG